METESKYWGLSITSRQKNRVRRYGNIWCWQCPYSPPYYVGPGKAGMVAYTWLREARVYSFAYASQSRHVCHIFLKVLPNSLITGLQQRTRRYRHDDCSVHCFPSIL